jgi:hypothetical protein
MPIKGMKKVKLAIKEKKAEMNDKVYAAYSYGLGQVIEITPVHFNDGGRLKNNWMLSVNKPESKTTLIGNRGGASSYAQLAELPPLVIGKKIFFTNNLPYAPIVEYGGYPSPAMVGTYDKATKKYVKISKGGYSPQAPEGMARINIKKIQERIRK